MPEPLVAPRIEEIISQPGQVLLINSPAVDLRLPWRPWHQPAGLLQIGAALQKRGCDIRLIDCLQPDQDRQLTRRKVGSVRVEGFELDLWHFGVHWGYLAKTLKSLKKQDWTPDVVFVSCFVTSWWQGAQELVRRLKEEWLMDVPVVLGGVYPTLMPEHAAVYTQADIIVVGAIPEARREAPQLELYGINHMPRFAGIYLYQPQSVTDVSAKNGVAPRPPGEIADEIVHKAELGVTEFAFFDEEIRLDQRHHWLQVLKAIGKRNLDIRFVALGNISPALIDGAVAREMGQAGYRQVCLKCDVTHQPDGIVYDTPYEVYQACVTALHREAGFKPRTDQLTAMLLIGNPYEEIEVITERLIRLASVVGSVNLVQYQYSPGTTTGRMYESLVIHDNGYLNPTTLNCKLYPLAQSAGTPYEHYVELTRLAALLNSKFRSKTFDFLDHGLTAQAVQNNLRERAWDPFRSKQEPDSNDIFVITPNSLGGPDQQ